MADKELVESELADLPILSEPHPLHWTNIAAAWAGMYIPRLVTQSPNARFWIASGFAVGALLLDRHMAKGLGRNRYRRELGPQMFALGAILEVLDAAVGEGAVKIVTAPGA